MRGKGHTWHQDMPRTLSHSDHHLNTELSVLQLGPYPLSDLISYHLPPSPAPATSASLLVLWHAQALASGPLHLLSSLPGRLFHTVHSLIFPSLRTPTMHDNFRIMGRGKKRQEFLHTKPLLHSASRMFQHAGETWGCVIKDTRLAIRRAGILFWLSHLIDKLLKFSLLYLNRSEPSTQGYTVHLFIHAGHLNRHPWLHVFTVWWETQMDWNSPTQ